MLDFKKIIEAVEFISKEKNIPKESLIEVIESALKTAYKKDYWSKDENVNVKVDLSEWDFEITVEKTIVEEVENSAIEISFDELWEDWEDFEIWDIIELDVTDNVKEWGLGDTFWRIASQAAKQVISQKFQEVEKKKVYELFKNRQWELVSARVQLIESGKVVLEYEWNQLTLPKSEQASRDRYEQWQSIFLYIAEVSNTEEEGPKVVLTRKSKEFVEKLFEMNVPEIGDWTVKIIWSVRQPWVKTKILVDTDYDEVDPAGTLIWPKWMRVKSIMNELNWEKIDVIPANEELEIIVSKALSPAKVSKVEISEESDRATVYVPSEERAKALWKAGLNVTQASMLLDMDIDVVEE